MAYIKNEWVDQQVERPKTYQLNENVDGSVTLIDDFGTVTEIGTPVNADNMNHIEDGVAGIAIRLFNLDETFALKEWVKDNEKIYKSKQNQNKGHTTSENDWWEEVSLGGGMPVGLIVRSLASSVENGLYTNGTEFTKGQLPTFYNDWLIGGLIPTITYEQYQTELTMTGECWSVALDSARETFRVPFIKNEVLRDVKATTSANATIPVRGNGKTLGLTNGNENAGLTRLPSNNTGLRGNPNAYNAKVGTDVGDHKAFEPNQVIGITTDPAKSGLIADLSSGNITTNTSKQTKVIKHFLVVATGSIKQSEMDWSRYMDGLQGKANIDLNNADQSKLVWNKITNCPLKTPANWITFNGNTVTLHKGTEFLISNGYNVNGQVNNVYKKIENDVNMVVNPTWPQYLPIAYWANTNAMSVAVNYVESNERPPQTDCYWRSESDNKTRRILQGNIVGERIIVLGYLKHTNGVAERIDLFSGAVRLLDYRQFALTPHIIQSYVNGTSGYNVYSNGYCEQWGIADVHGDGSLEVILLKSLKDTNYMCQGTIRSSFGTSTDAGIGVYPVDTTKIRILCGAGGGSGIFPINWLVHGYIY